MSSASLQKISPLSLLRYLQNEDNELFIKVKAEQRANLNIEMSSIIDGNSSVRMSNKQQEKELMNFYTQKYQQLTDEEEELMKQKKMNKQRQFDPDQMLNEAEIPLQMSPRVDPNKLNVHVISQQNFKVDFPTLIELIRSEMPYATESDLFSFQVYMKHDGHDHASSLDRQFKQFCNSSKYRTKQYSMMEFLRLSYLLAPEQLKRIKMNQLFLFFYYADEMFNTYANAKLLQSLLSYHYPQIKDFFPKLITQQSDIDKNKFEMHFIPKIVDELKKNNIDDIILNLSNPNLDEFSNKKKQDTAFLAARINKQISSYIMELRASGRKQLAPNPSQENLLLYEKQAKKQKNQDEIERALGE